MNVEQVHLLVTQYKARQRTLQTVFEAIKGNDDNFWCAVGEEEPGKIEFQIIQGEDNVLHRIEITSMDRDILLENTNIEEF